MSTSREFDNPARYEIVLKGKLDPIWLDWFDGFRIEPCPKDETVLCGQVADQAALHGLLSKIRDLGLPLLSVTCLAAVGPVPEELDEKQGRQDRQGHSHVGGGNVRQWWA